MDSRKRYFKRMPVEPAKQKPYFERIPVATVKKIAQRFPAEEVQEDDDHASIEQAAAEGDLPVS